MSDPGFLSSPFEAFALAEAVRLARPFAALLEAARLEQLRLAGMHAPTYDHRIGCDAFEVRSDLSVGDACETVDQLLRQVHATLDILAMSADVNRAYAESCAACAVLAKQASGALAVVKAAVFPANLRRGSGRPPGRPSRPRRQGLGQRVARASGGWRVVVLWRTQANLIEHGTRICRGR